MAGDYPYYGSTNIQSYINEYRVEGEHALIGEDGDHFLKWRDISMTLLVNGRFNVNNHAHLIKGAKNLTIWFYYFFAQKDLTLYLTRQGAGRYKLTKKALASIPCILPPLPEQESIACVLSDTDALITSLDKLIAKKRDIKQAAMQQLLTGKQRLEGFGDSRGKFKQTEIGLIPEDWDIKRVGDICDFIVPGRNKPRIFEGDIPWITTPDLEDGRSVSKSRLNLYISKDEAKNVGSKIVPTGSILMSCVGELGIVALTENEIVINQQLHAFIPSSIIDKFFLLNVIKIQKNYIEGLATKTAVPYLNKDNCNSIPILLPSLPEQRAIAKVLSDIDSEISALEQRRDKTKALKQAMMQELLTGKTRLKS